MNWSTYSPEQLRTGYDSQGNRLVEAFARDFKSKVGRQLNIGCPSCFLSDYREFLTFKESTIMSKPKYVVHAKYAGISMRNADGKFIQLSNTSQDVEAALYFLNNHPHGAKLFKVAPTTAEGDQAQRLADDNKRGDLNAMAKEAGIENPEKMANKLEVATAIVKAVD